MMSLLHSVHVYRALCRQAIVYGRDLAVGAALKSTGNRTDQEGLLLPVVLIDSSDRMQGYKVTSSEIY